MAERAIDYDRGVVIRVIDRLNMEVFMYADQPGVYYSAHGKELNSAIAEQAGYDVTRYEAQRQHRERMLAASTLIAEELKLTNDEGIRKVVEFEGDFRIVSIGRGRHEIEDKQGNILTPGAALPLDLARTVMRGMARKGTPELPIDRANRGAGARPGAVAGKDRAMTQEALGGDVPRAADARSADRN